MMTHMMTMTMWDEWPTRDKQIHHRWETGMMVDIVAVVVVASELARADCW